MPPPTFKELPSEHGPIDRAFLNAYAHSCAWHTAPEYPRADDLVYERSDIMEWLRRRIENTLRQSDFKGLVHEKHGLKETELGFQDLGNNRKFMRHLAHSALSMSAQLHTGIVDKDRMMITLRHNLNAITHGQIIADECEHPLWGYGNLDVSARRPRKIIKAAKPDQQFARYLRGDKTQYLKGPEGPIADLIEQAAPELLSRDPDCRLLSYAPKLRRDLLKMVEGKEYWDDQLQQECIGLTLEQWEKSVPLTIAKSLSELEKEMGIPRDNGFKRFVRTYVRPYLDKQDGAKTWRTALEEYTLLKAEDGTPEEMKEIIEEWIHVLTTKKEPFCRLPTLGMATLSLIARSGSVEEFRERLQTVDED